MPNRTEPDPRVGAMCQQIARKGVRSGPVLEALRTVPREVFVPEPLRDLAYGDHALAIGHGQTISQPYMVAAMTDALALTGSERVLEIGTGTGYQTAVLARLAGRVFTVERIAELSRAAEDRLSALGLAGVSYHVGDGSRGWPQVGPFEAILVTAGAPRTPPALLEQLDPMGGRLVVPVGGPRLQDLLRVTREGTAYRTERLMACRFVPLVGEDGWETTAP